MDSARNQRRQIRLRSVFASMIWCGVAFGLVKWCLRHRGTPPDQREVDAGMLEFMVLFLGVPVLIGAAIGTLFGRPLAGAAGGCLAMVLLYLALTLISLIV